MMFSLKEFIKSGLLKAIGKMADYQVILNATGWHEKGVLEETSSLSFPQAVKERIKVKDSKNTNNFFIINSFVFFDSNIVNYPKGFVNIYGYIWL